MGIAKRALKEIYPDLEENRQIIIKYSKAFNDFNANVKYSHYKIEFRLSDKWKEVSEDIVIGLMQTLFVKMYGKKAKTMNIDLYTSFIKKLSIYNIQDKSDPILEKSFHRVNEKYFNGFMDIPNLAFGGPSSRKLGSYEYATNTIVVSTLFKEEDEILDYIMYHELLHKKLKFHDKNGRNYHHTKKFRDMEKQFENQDIEKKLENFLRRHKMKKIFRFW